MTVASPPELVTLEAIREAAHQLLGPDHNPAMYRSGLRQQGLLQIYFDFCVPAEETVAPAAAG